MDEGAKNPPKIPSRPSAFLLIPSEGSQGVPERGQGVAADPGLPCAAQDWRTGAASRRPPRIRLAARKMCGVTAAVPRASKRLVTFATGISMRAMRRLVFGMLAATVGCAPSLEADHVKTPDEILAEQERLGAEQEKKGKQYDTYADGTTDEEQKRQWDEDYAQLELRRASRSAETCLDSVAKEEKAQKGRARVTLVFKNEGNVKSSSVGEPYTDTVVGKCVLNAMGAVIVKTYEGPEKTVEWEVDLTGAKKSGPVGGGTSAEE